MVEFINTSITMYKKLLIPPLREYVLGLLVIFALILGVTPFSSVYILFAAAFIGSLPTFLSASHDIFKRRITIDVFNAIAITIAFLAGEISSAAFIALMLTFARLLDWRTISRTKNALEELLKLKPSAAIIERDGNLAEIPASEVKKDDVVVIKEGVRIPVDGVVIMGTALINESSVTGESALVEKKIGDTVLALTLNESGMTKIRATRVGKDSTSERMVELLKQATERKSHPEKLADKFAKIFLPIVALIGATVYFITRDASMTAALFLVACADDMAVAIPLAITASIGNAAKRGIIIRSGDALEAASKVRTFIFDKTGTLTYGKPVIKAIKLYPSIDEAFFWKLVASAEKFSEHPLGKALFEKALTHAGDAPDPDDFKVYKGNGVWARVHKDEIVIGNEGLFAERKLSVSEDVLDDVITFSTKERATMLIVFINGVPAGLVALADMPRAEAKASIEQLRKIGIKNISIFTGDRREAAEGIARELDINDVHFEMLPENKLCEIEKLEEQGFVAMVGDGVNDAPALSRVDLGIAMGDAGTAVTVEAADVVILTDNLSKLPEAILIGRRAMSVIRVDGILWVTTNLLGFVLVLSGVAGPALAAFYNLVTDFLPLLNSTRLFRDPKKS